MLPGRGHCLAAPGHLLHAFPGSARFPGEPTCAREKTRRIQNGCSAGSVRQSLGAEEELKEAAIKATRKCDYLHRCLDRGLSSPPRGLSAAGHGKFGSQRHHQDISGDRFSQTSPRWILLGPEWERGSGHMHVWPHAGSTLALGQASLTDLGMLTVPLHGLPGPLLQDLCPGEGGAAGFFPSPQPWPSACPPNKLLLPATSAVSPQAAALHLASPPIPLPWKNS